MQLRQLLDHWLHPRFRYRQLAIIHGMRLALAFLTARLIGEWISEPHAVWMTVTVAVVMGSLPHTGSIVEKGKQRFLGTTLGALGGFLVILLSHVSAPLSWLAILLIIGYSGFWGVRGGGYVALLTCITLAIVSTNSTLDVGLWRMANVYAGIVLAIGFGMLFPERARDHWYYMLEERLEGLYWLYRELALRNVYNTTLATGLSQRHSKMRELISATARESGLGAAPLKAIINLLHRAQLTLEFLASEASDPQRTERVERGDEARIQQLFSRLARRLDLPLNDPLPALCMPSSPQQAWLLSMLARHLEDLETQLDQALPHLKGQVGSELPFQAPWPPNH